MAFLGVMAPPSLVLELCPGNVEYHGQWATVPRWLPPAWMTLWTQLSTQATQGPCVQGFNLTWWHASDYIIHDLEHSCDHILPQVSALIWASPTPPPCSATSSGSRHNGGCSAPLLFSHPNAIKLLLHLMGGWPASKRCSSLELAAGCSTHALLG